MEKRLSVDEREEISCGLILERSFRAIGRRLGRAPSTVSREVDSNGGRSSYRAVAAESAVEMRARRPKLSKLTANGALRSLVEAKRKISNPVMISERPEHVEDRIASEPLHDLCAAPRCSQP